MDWSIQDIARLSGTTSRTLRHYGDVGLLVALMLTVMGIIVATTWARAPRVVPATPVEP